MKKGCMIAVGLLALLGVSSALGLLFLASRAKPLPGIEGALASLPAAERAALLETCRRAGVDAASLRPIAGHSERLFGDDRNRRAIHVEAGHLRGLCLAGGRFSQPPDVRALGALEALWLQDGTLSEWPDLSSQGALLELRLDGQPLGTPPAGHLPPNLRTLGLARTRVSDVTPLAALRGLTRLLLADTPVTDFSPLLELSLETLDLARTRVATVPTTLPRHGAWEVDLTDTPSINPPGFSWTGPGGWSFSGTALGDETRRGGPVRGGGFEISGSGSQVPALRPVSLPTARGTSQAVEPVRLEASIEAGRARIWLGEAPGAFTSPWFTRGHVKGFGFVRRSGYAYADVAAGETSRLRGTLMLVGSTEHNDFYFLVQPLGDVPVTGLRYRVVSDP
jgi:Leucine-rich repeat (LRR) protein